MFGSEPLTVNKDRRHLRFKGLKSHLTPLKVFSRICGTCDYSYLLESLEGPRKLAQYSFIGFEPQLVFRSRGGRVEVEVREGDAYNMVLGDPLPELRRMLESRYLPFTGFRLIGGAVGYVSYDAIRYWESLPRMAESDTSFPDVELGFYDDGLIFDHRKRKSYYYHSSEDRWEILEEVIKEPSELQSLDCTGLDTNMSKEVFEEGVVRAKEYIASGDILQVVLSKRFQLDYKGSLLHFYNSLRRINPSPYMFFLNMGKRRIVGSSPEMLMRVVDGVVESYPIAGTRPRVQDEHKNRALAKELLSDPKERAEHLMLVDLARNDVGRVSEFGSVRVPQFMEVHQYSHVQHIVSRVVGRLRDNCDSFDCLRAIFPAGTVSGAPKVRAMEIIEETEPTRRGPYAGAVGYFSFNGNSDFAITIRTLTAEEGRAYVQVGGGIVANSIPEREWFETEHKARALIRALEESVGEVG